MSIARSLELSLSQLIEESNLVLEVKFVKRYKEEVPIADKSSKDPVKVIPPFIKEGCVFNTGSIFKNNTGIKEMPSSIQVPDENWRRFFSQHKAKYLKTQDKSYTVKEYHSEVPSIEKASILFLCYFQGMFELTAISAFESTAAHEKITMLLSPTRRSAYPK